MRLHYASCEGPLYNETFEMHKVRVLGLVALVWFGFLTFILKFEEKNRTINPVSKI